MAHHHCTFFSFCSALHHGYCNGTDTSSLHFLLLMYLVDFTAPPFFFWMFTLPCFNTSIWIIIRMYSILSLSSQLYLSAIIQIAEFYCYLLARGFLLFFYLSLLATVAKVLSLASFEICIYCIFIIMNKCVVGWEKTRNKLKVVHAKINKKCTYIYP